MRRKKAADVKNSESIKSHHLHIEPKHTETKTAEVNDTEAAKPVSVYIEAPNTKAEHYEHNKKQRNAKLVAFGVAILILAIIVSAYMWYNYPTTELTKCQRASESMKKVYCKEIFLSKINDSLQRCNNIGNLSIRDGCILKMSTIASDFLNDTGECSKINNTKLRISCKDNEYFTNYAVKNLVEECFLITNTSLKKECDDKIILRTEADNKYKNLTRASLNNNTNVFYPIRTKE